MCIEQAIDLYQNQRQYLNYSPKTIRAQVLYLGIFGDFMKKSKIASVLEVTFKHLQSFQHEVFYKPTAKGRPRSIASQSQILIAVKNLYKLLHEQQKLIAFNPAKDLELPKKGTVLPKNILTIEEAEKLLNAPDMGTPIGYRDRTILEVFYATGIRRGELLSLKVNDVNLSEGLLRICYGKGAKDRMVPLSDTAVKFLQCYLYSIRPELLKNAVTDVLFVSTRRSGPIGGTTLDTMLERYTKKAGIKKRVTAHVWRHTCATHMVQNNANLRHVQELLGHRALTTTEVYLRLTITDLKEAHRKFHPRE